MWRHVSLGTGVSSRARCARRDLGCGRGELAYHFARRGFEVTAVDYSDAAIRIAEQTFEGDPDLRSKVELCCTNINNLNLTGSYDIAVASDIIEHLTAKELDSLYDNIADTLGSGRNFRCPYSPQYLVFQIRLRAPTPIGIFAGSLPAERTAYAVRIAHAYQRAESPDPEPATGPTFC